MNMLKHRYSWAAPCFLLLGLNSVEAREAYTFFVKNGGDDSKSGTSDTNAWASISKVNSEFTSGNFQAGDTIQFKCGDKWDERLVIKQDGTASLNITIGAYGSGEKPMIGGLIEYDSGDWSATSGRDDVYEASAQFELFVVSEYVSSTELSPLAGWARVYRRFHVDQAQGHGVCDNNNCLDDVEATEGSFWYDGSVDKLYIHAFDDANPATASIIILGNQRVGAFPTNVSIDASDADYITIQDLHLVNTVAGVRGQSSTYLTIKDCRMSGNDSGVYITGEDDPPNIVPDPTQITVYDNDVRYCSNGIKFVYSDHLFVYDNIVAGIKQRWHPDTDLEAIAFSTCDDAEAYGNTVYDSQIGIATYAEEEFVFNNVDFHNNYIYGTTTKGFQMSGPGEHGGEIYVHSNILWMDPSESTHGILIYMETEDVTPRKSYQIWNNTIQARQGIRLGVDGSTEENHKRVDHVIKNNILHNCRYHIVDEDETQNTSSEQGDDSTYDRNYNNFYPIGASNELSFDGPPYHESLQDYQDTDVDESASMSVDIDSSCGMDLEGPVYDFEPSGCSLVNGGTDPPNDIPFDPDVAVDMCNCVTRDAGYVSIGACEDCPLGCEDECGS